MKQRINILPAITKGLSICVLVCLSVHIQAQVAIDIVQYSTNGDDGILNVLLDEEHLEMPATFLWSNEATTQQIENLGTGDYFVTITDANACEYTLEVTLEGCEMIDCYPDNDGDGYGDANATPMTGCDCPGGYVPDNSDCDDSKESINPGVVEAASGCNGVDDNCNGEIDEGIPNAFVYYRDADGDGFGDYDHPVYSCEMAASILVDGVVYLEIGGDCNDTNAEVNPNGTEICDNLDNNCDAQIDEGITKYVYYADFDQDGFATDGQTTLLEWCDNIEDLIIHSGIHYVKVQGDCDDEDNQTYPGAPELCDLKDNDCDGLDDYDDPDANCLAFQTLPGDLILTCAPITTLEQAINQWLGTNGGATAQMGIGCSGVTFSNSGVVLIDLDYEGGTPYPVTFTVIDDCGFTRSATASIVITGYTPITLTLQPTEYSGSTCNNTSAQWINSHGGANASSCFGIIWTTNKHIDTEVCSDNNLPMWQRQYSFTAKEDRPGGRSITTSKVYLRLEEPQISVTDPGNLILTCADLSQAGDLFDNWFAQYSVESICHDFNRISTYHDFDLTNLNTCGVYTVNLTAAVTNYLGTTQYCIIDNRTVQLTVGSATLELTSAGSDKIIESVCSIDPIQLKTDVDNWLASGAGYTATGCGATTISYEIAFSDYVDPTTYLPYSSSCKFVSFMTSTVTFTILDQCRQSTTFERSLRYNCSGFDVNITQDCDDLVANIEGGCPTSSTPIYRWLKDGKEVQEGPSNVYTITDPVAAYYIVELDCGCTAKSSSITTFKGDGFGVDISQNCGQLEAQAYGCTSPNSQFYWYRNDQLVATTTSPTYSLTTPGDAEYRVAIECGCAAVSEILMIDYEIEPTIPSYTYVDADVLITSSDVDYFSSINSYNETFSSHSLRNQVDESATWLSGLACNTENFVGLNVCDLNIQSGTYLVLISGDDDIQFVHNGNVFTRSQAYTRSYLISLSLDQNSVLEFTAKDQHGGNCWFSINIFDNSLTELKNGIQNIVYSSFNLHNQLTGPEYISGSSCPDCYTLANDQCAPQCILNLQNSNNASQNLELSLVESIKQYYHSLINLYPNPTSALLNIDIDHHEETTAQMYVLDMLGSRVYEQSTHLLKGLNKIQLKTEQWPDGIYYLMVTDRTGLLHQKKIEIIHR